MGLGLVRKPTNYQEKRNVHFADTPTNYERRNAQHMARNAIFATGETTSSLGVKRSML